MFQSVPGRCEKYGLTSNLTTKFRWANSSSCTSTVLRIIKVTHVDFQEDYPTTCLTLTRRGVLSRGYESHFLERS